MHPGSRKEKQRIILFDLRPSLFAGNDGVISNDSSRSVNSGSNTIAVLYNIRKRRGFVGNKNYNSVSSVTIRA